MISLIKPQVVHVNKKINSHISILFPSTSQKFFMLNKTLSHKTCARVVLFLNYFNEENGYFYIFHSTSKLIFTQHYHFI